MLGHQDVYLATHDSLARFSVAVRRVFTGACSPQRKDGPAMGPVLQAGEIISLSAIHEQMRCAPCASLGWRAGAALARAIRKHCQRRGTRRLQLTAVRGTASRMTTARAPKLQMLWPMLWPRLQSILLRPRLQPRSSRARAQARRWKEAWGGCLRSCMPRRCPAHERPVAHKLSFVWSCYLLCTPLHKRPFLCTISLASGGRTWRGLAQLGRLPLFLEDLDGGVGTASVKLQVDGAEKRLPAGGLLLEGPAHVAAGRRDVALERVDHGEVGVEGRAVRGRAALADGAVRVAHAVEPLAITRGGIDPSARGDGTKRLIELQRASQVLQRLCGAVELAEGVASVEVRVDLDGRWARLKGQQLGGPREGGHAIAEAEGDVGEVEKREALH
mmetsp:Transcript_39054/g.78094  ORF Transcript_39054/g.78094 Transcript_39054/m.78094 type:complete len:387 (+) Transcript_39054:131-1291(+)